MNSSLRVDTKTGRARLTPRREPYWHKCSTDRHLGFRKLISGSCTWIARWRGEDGKREYKALGDLTDEFGFDQAMAAALAWFKDRDRGVRPTMETVADVCREYVKDRERQKGKAAANQIDRCFQRTVYGRPKASRARAIPSNAIGSVALSKVRSRLIEEWRDELVKGGLSKSSANRTLTALRAALNYAMKHRYVSADAAMEWKAVEPFKDASKRRDLYLDLAQRRALLAASDGALHDLIAATMLTGARPGELVSARRSQYDARTETLYLTGKTGTRPVSLSAAAVTLFNRLAKDKLPGAFLLTRSDGQAWQHSDWDELVRDAAAKADLPKGTCLYTLRHSWITQAIGDGMNVLDVARLVGTSVAMIDKNYGHLAQTASRERLAKVMMV